MKFLTDEEIQFLISCPKVIITPPKTKLVLTQSHFRNGMELSSQDGGYRFTAFMRKNEMFQENFSIGLRYHPAVATQRALFY